MPNSYLKSLVDKTDKSMEELEALWSKAKQLSKESGKDESDPNFYAYTVGIFKRMTSISRTCIPVSLSKSSRIYPKFEIRLGYVDDYETVSSSPNVQRLLDSVNMLNRPSREKRIVLVDATDYPVRELAVYDNKDPKSGSVIRGCTWWAMTDLIKDEFNLEM